MKSALLLGLCFLASCSSAPAAKDEPHYRVNAFPGPEGFEDTCRFERGALSVEATGDLEDGLPFFELDLRNRGAGRIVVTPAGIRLLYNDRISQESVQLFVDGEDRQLQVVLLGYERKRVTVRPAGNDVRPEGPIVLEVRGLRDDRGDGGFDFDLRAIPR
jgi:hypothetical protein